MFSVTTRRLLLRSNFQTFAHKPLCHGPLPRFYVSEETMESYSIMKALISTYRKSYEQGETLINDHDYDKLYEQLLSIEKENPELVTEQSPSQIVAPLVSDRSIKKIHHLPMLGLQNVYDDDGLIKFEKKIYKELNLLKEEYKNTVEFVAEMKYDGMAVSLIFGPDGAFQYAKSRGDGLYGEDLTTTFLKHVCNLPLTQNHQLRVPATGEIVEIRGEIVGTSAELERINSVRTEKGLKIFSNCRNLVTGSLNKQLDQTDNDPALHSNLHLICYSLYIYQPRDIDPSDFKQLKEQQVNFSKLQPPTQMECLQKLSEWNFTTCPRALRFNSFKDELLAYVKKYQVEEVQKQFPFITDGVAVKVNSIEQQFRLGRVARAYRWATAYKFPTQSHCTGLLDIQFQIGRTGRATPVAIMEPILIDGSTVSNCTLHNMAFIEQHKLQVGGQVNIEKSGGTIPKITGGIPPLDPSTPSKVIELVCPCPLKMPLVKRKDSVDHFCSNEQCPEARTQTFIHFAQALSIKGLGESLVFQLLEAGIIEIVSDIFILHTKEEEMLRLPRLGKKKVSNLIQAIEEVKNTAKLDHILKALAIPNVGDVVCSQIANNFKCAEDLLYATTPQLTNKGVSATQAKIIHNFFQQPENIEIIKRLGDYGLPAARSQK